MEVVFDILKTPTHVSDLTGKSFGRLTVLGFSSVRSRANKIQWVCECVCGNKILVQTSNLKQGHTTSCGCVTKELLKSRKIDLSQQVFGKWKVLNESTTKSKKTYWKCRCQCGKEQDVYAGALLSGKSLGCSGCKKLAIGQNRENLYLGKYKHGSSAYSHGCRCEACLQILSTSYKIYDSKRRKTVARKSWLNNYSKQKRTENPNIKLRGNLRTLLRVYLTRQNVKKTNSVLRLLSCSIEFFKKHIESQFVTGMTWENYGRGGWHIDHIIPCSYFDLKNEEEQWQCFHFRNLRPLWERENIIKSSLYLGKRFSHIEKEVS